ncbi:hypothetical protein PILCRDRAFT_815423 [Piloderma croceum F 1598]|uniref:Uncharacterized protein n=1 Tax=Piloderma croceum (strain F 1598) TaxID=765440 RepID=A0A0C3CB90_PILCF|nr:hypothetical protein PILCRDRAFT_815423 [Piloderma croceum F 1598]
MSATLAVARRSYYSATLSYCRPSPFYSMGNRHGLPPVSVARSYSSGIVDRSVLYRIQTLHPSRLRSSDLMDISSKLDIYVHTPGSQSSFRGKYYGVHRFPEGTRGFLYYKSPKVGGPPAAGELRFRLITGNTPASFVQGSDLQLETGLPWCIPLLTMIERPGSIREGRHYQCIRQLLLDDGFVTPALLKTCAAMLNSNSCRPRRNSRIIHSFGELFHISFDAFSVNFFALSKDQLRYHKYQGFYDSITRKPSYSGSALCCFERSNLPQHKGTRTAVIRIVKIISPVTCLYPNYYGPITLPVEGELVHRIYRHGGLQPVSFKADSTKTMGLQMLFQNES